MFGSKPLSEIKDELRRALGANAASIDAWIDQKMAELQPKKERDPRVVEDLVWVRDELRQAVREGKAKTKGTKPRKSKKSPAA